MKGKNKQITDLHSHKKHSHKKREDSLESRRYRILFAAELEFPKILVPSLCQNSSNVNLEFAGKLSQLHSLCDQPLGALTSLFYCSDINLCLWLIIPGENCENLVKTATGIVEHNSRRIKIQEYQHTGVTPEEQHCFSYYS